MISQALVHLLSEADSGLLLIQAEKKAAEETRVKSNKSIDISANIVGESPLKLAIPGSTSVSLLSPIAKEKEKEKEKKEFTGDRPVIHFNTPQSHMQLTPQRDVQVSWTVEFWLKREEPSVIHTQSVQPDVIPAGLASVVTEGLSSRVDRDRGDRRPLRGLLSLGARPPNPTDPDSTSVDKIQSSISKLSQMLGSEYRGLRAVQPVWGWSDTEEQGSIEAGMADAFDSLEGRRGESSWTLVPPAAGILGTMNSISLEPDSRVENFSLSGLVNRAQTQALALAQVQGFAEGVGEGEGRGGENVGGGQCTGTGGLITQPVKSLQGVDSDGVGDVDGDDAQLSRGRALRDLLDSISELESLHSQTGGGGGIEPSGGQRVPDMALGSEEFPSLPPPGFPPASEDFPPSTARPAKHVPTARGSSKILAVKKFLLPLITQSEERAKKELAEVKAVAKECSLTPIYLMSSSGGHIKLQMGGRVFSGDDFTDTNQFSQPVHNQALCLSIGQRGAAEKSFDYVVPSGCWIHIAISCSVGVSSSGTGSVVSLYANGELKDSQNMRCNLPVGTLGSSRKGQSFAGHMCDVRIWNCARSAAEIKRDLHTDVSGNSSSIHSSGSLFILLLSCILILFD